MASSLRSFSSNLVKRSMVVPTVVSASRFLIINAGHRSYSTTPKDDFNEQPLLRIACPTISSMSFMMKMRGKTRSLKLEIPDDGLTVELKKLGYKKDMSMRACAAQQNTLFIQGINQTLDKTSSDTKEDEFKTNTILNDMANDIITGFHDIDVNHSWSYYDMFSDRSILGEGLCRVIAMPSPIYSFTLCKEEYAYDLEIEMCIPGKEEMKLTTQGLRVCLDEMHEFGREDVKTFFEYNTFFIEGRTKQTHHITCIHLPEGVHTKHNMIKREMLDEKFYAFLPCCGKMEELHHQLKLIK